MYYAHFMINWDTPFAMYVCLLIYIDGQPHATYTFKLTIQFKHTAYIFNSCGRVIVVSLILFDVDADLIRLNCLNIYRNCNVYLSLL